MALTLLEAARQLGLPPAKTAEDLESLAFWCEDAGLETNMDDEPVFATLRQAAHEQLDPHCTCNSCLASFEGRVTNGHES